MAAVIEPLVLGGMRVIAVDARGHGRSTRTSEAPSHDLIVSDYIHLLHMLKVCNVRIIADSDGGNCALLWAARFPGRVRALYLMGAVMAGDGVESMLSKEELRSIAVPTVIAIDGKQELAAASHSQQLAEAIPNAELVTIDDADAAIKSILRWLLQIR
jgi:pimeloyl-ACP methyl ester carboxylesterase